MTQVNTTARTPAISVDISTAAALANLTIQHSALTLRFADGSAASLSTVDLSMEILSQALVHGLKQKLVDAAAIARNTDTGQSATLADKKDAVLKVLARLESGQWNVGRTGGDGGTGKGSILFIALARLQPNRDRVELEAWVKGRTDAERAALMQNPKILPTVQAIQAERAAAKNDKAGINSDELLEGLGL